MGARGLPRPALPAVPALLLLLLCLVVAPAARAAARGHRDDDAPSGGGGGGTAAPRLWVFGDSYADTGNLGDLGRELTHAWYDPYGDTFPGRPTGRFSDGRVLTDFVEDDDDDDIPLDLNEHEADDGNTSFDLNEPVHDEHGNGFNLNLPLDEFGAVDFDYVQNLADHVDQVNQRKHDYSDNVRQQVYQALLMRSKSGRLGKHDTTIVGDKFGVKIRTVQRIWQQGKNQLVQNIPVKVPNLKKGRSGRKAIPLDLENLRNIPLQQRMTIEDVSNRLGISKSRIQRYLKIGVLRRHSSSIKPYLTYANKKTRLQWCIDMIDQGLLDDPKFKDLFDFVFIDEKWFYLHQKSERYYLLPDEDEPHRTCKNKNYIPRIMFLCVVARPRFRDGVCVFDGKIGCFPLVTIEQAIRGSHNRLRGEQVIKPIQSITRDVIRDFMINRVLPAIRAKWPREDVHKPIFIQQDNAPTHLKVDDPQFCEVAKQDGFDIRLICQPPNSPDFNVLDLGFFRAIQAIQYKKNAKTMQELIPVVEEAFLEYSPWKANRIFVTLQTVLKEAMKIKGCNNIKIPHLQKQRLEREDRLPLQIPCEASLLAEAQASLPA